ncbi:hypothetical protein [Sulfurimonas sp.]|uniref:hypothetical protein n=1 Tax=Sulfurimonas sp. TaxID=2022749 RepID=UPI003D0A0CA0
MCIPHGTSTIKSETTIKDKPKKHIEKPSKNMLEKGDPNFIDERKPYTPKKKSSFF